MPTVSALLWTRPLGPTYPVGNRPVFRERGCAHGSSSSVLPRGPHPAPLRPMRPLRHVLLAAVAGAAWLTLSGTAAQADDACTICRDGRRRRRESGGRRLHGRRRPPCSLPRRPGRRPDIAPAPAGTWSAGAVPGPRPDVADAAPADADEPAQADPGLRPVPDSAPPATGPAASDPTPAAVDPALPDPAVTPPVVDPAPVPPCRPAAGPRLSHRSLSHRSWSHRSSVPPVVDPPVVVPRSSSHRSWTHRSLSHRLLFRPAVVPGGPGSRRRSAGCRPRRAAGSRSRPALPPRVPQKQAPPKQARKGAPSQQQPAPAPTGPDAARPLEAYRSPVAPVTYAPWLMPEPRAAAAPVRVWRCPSGRTPCRDW